MNLISFDDVLSFHQQYNNKKQQTPRFSINQGFLMSKSQSIALRHAFDHYLPRSLRQFLKRVYWKIIRFQNRCFHLKKAELVEIGNNFRFSREMPYKGQIGNNSIIEDYNIWNAKAGDIIVGKNCWIGLHNILMGPLEMGDHVSTGPYVFILGPRHAKIDTDERKQNKTMIGNDVWISTGAIILFGIHIGDHAIIGPGSVVTKDIPENAYVSGNPARNLSGLAETVWEKGATGPHQDSEYRTLGHPA